MRGTTTGHWQLTTALLLLAAQPAGAATADIETLDVDLAPLIDVAARDSDRFAVEVPHRVSPATHGEWTTDGSRRTWRYAVRIPGAVSLSFTAGRARLPASASLTVTAGAQSSRYTASDTFNAALASRIARGDALRLELSVAAAEESATDLVIDGFQAGYRGLGGGVTDHPRFAQLKQSQEVVPASCHENFACHTTPENGEPGHSTVAIVISNLSQCTGTLVRNVPDDGTPYVVTARHCQSSASDGGPTGTAVNARIYWNVVSACGATLETIYGPSVRSQLGATSVVEQQDVWLLRLAAPPVATNAAFAGWDATGGGVVGGYSVHHATGNAQQYTRWFGQAVLQHASARELGTGYDTKFWGVVNELGSVAPGASGGALFDSAHRLVGVASRAQLPGGQASCPTDPVRPPSSDYAIGYYTALSEVFSSTIDTSSRTGATTLQSVLDPAGTGTRVVGGSVAGPPALNPTVTMTASASSQMIGHSVTLQWTSRNASVCTASGGAAGDGWGGDVALAGTAVVTETQPGSYWYEVSCSGSPPAAASRVTITFSSIAAVEPVIADEGGGGGRIDWLLLMAALCGCVVAVRTSRS